MKYSNILCFAGKTLIKKANGQDSVISELKVGELIKTYNFETVQLVDKPILRIAKSFHSVISKILLSDNTEIICTSDHPIYIVGKGWCSVNTKDVFTNYGVNVNSIKEGDKCLGFERNSLLKEMEIVSIETLVGDFEMFAIATENNNFIANNILVHDENLAVLNLSNTQVEYSQL